MSHHEEVACSLFFFVCVSDTNWAAAGDSDRMRLGSVPAEDSDSFPVSESVSLPEVNHIQWLLMFT